jgi:hypothetical protein
MQRMRAALVSVSRIVVYPPPDRPWNQRHTLATRNPQLTRNQKSPVFMRVVTGLRVVTGFLNCAGDELAFLDSWVDSC